jgi:Holliday junction resolvase
MENIKAIFECVSIEDFGATRNVKLKMSYNRENMKFCHKESLNPNVEGTLKIFVDKGSDAEKLFRVYGKYRLSFEKF